MKILSGNEVSKVRRQKISEEVQQLKSKKGVHPGLAVVLVGEDPASQVYVRNKGKACEQVGIQSYEYKMSADTSANDLKLLIEKLNNDDRVH
ncbi:MAG: bifunctional 5,10-methylene-tetrahydrofolate dehydrogenase/5,10-methylene-tetrahydrofolate cyclohydrolase, partial [Bdellovibrionales bacterium]|nr:bifunctional 5,10-methylene-tetrahydrofolate dehydrogenase/5,10-methylene-tetrahydrofolate cyclohydrolase [Bdellovibrionales bacterium]